MLEVDERNGIKMKISAIFILCVIMVTLMAGGHIKMNVDPLYDIAYFSVDDYEYFVNRFPSDKVLGPIDSAEMAKEKAESVWLEIYGNDVQEKQSYIVSYDKENGLWMVQGKILLDFSTDEKELLIPAFGGVPNIIIQESDGKVLAVWHDK